MGDRKGDSNRRRSLCWAKVRIHHFSGFFLTWWGRSSSFYTLWPRHLSCFFIQTTCIANEISIAVSSLQGSWHSATISNITIILLWRGLRAELSWYWMGETLCRTISHSHVDCGDSQSSPNKVHHKRTEHKIEMSNLSCTRSNLLISSTTYWSLY